MTFDLKRRAFAIGPLIMAGQVMLFRLWLWDYVRCGRQHRFIWHKR